MRTKMKQRQGAVTLIHTVTLLVMMILTGMAFMMWAADEAHQAEFDLARTQAYYIAQHGIMQTVLPVMKNRSAETLPAGLEVLQGASALDADGNFIGKYEQPYLKRLNDQVNQGVFSSTFPYELGATGVVRFKTWAPDRRGSLFREVRRKVTLTAKLRTFASYMYLTHHELTAFNEIIWFWTPDTLNGRVHSNDQIGLKLSPFFLGPVSSSADEFIESAANPYFAYEPQMGVPEVYFPVTAEKLRASAGNMGLYKSNQNGDRRSRLTCSTEYMRGGGNGVWFFEQWPAGTPYDSTIASGESIPMGATTTIFVEGDLQLWGNGVLSANTVGCSGNMQLMDDIRYANVTGMPFNVDDANGVLGLISEHDITIMDTQVNGQANGSVLRANPNAPHNRAHIVITAALVALNENFRFEHNNDIGDTYIYCAQGGANQASLDERGIIYLRGAVTQYRRGYVHRSNCGGTGYGKDYVYDFRLDKEPPPAYLEAEDDEGNALFDIVDWQRHEPAANRG